MIHTQSARKLGLIAFGGLAVAVVGGFYLGQTVLADGIPVESPMTYAGFLEDDGVPVHGSRSIRVTLYDHAASTALANVRCDTQQTNAQVVEGHFSIPLDNACAAAVRANRDLWLDVQVNGQSLGRTKLGAVPYAVEAERAASLAPGAFSGSGTAVTAARADHQHASLNALAVVGSGSFGQALTVDGAFTAKGAANVKGAATFEGRVTVPAGLRVGNSIFGAYVGVIPASGSYSEHPLHIQTGWRCGITDATFYRLRFSGYNFRGNSSSVGQPFEFVAVGYLIAGTGHKNNSIEAQVPSNLSFSSYCAAEGGGSLGGGYLTFKLSRASLEWHATDIVIDFLGGGHVLMKNGADTFTVRKYVNQAANL